MKRTLYLLTALLLAVAMTSCKAFHTLADSNQKTSQGRPYELIVVATQPVWTGELGDSLRAVLAAPIPYLPQQEPEFDVLRTTPDGFKTYVTFEESPNPIEHSRDKMAVAHYNMAEDPNFDAKSSNIFALTYKDKIVYWIQMPTWASAQAE